MKFPQLPLTHPSGPDWVRYLASAMGGWLRRREFASVKYYCNFLGTPRSGHTIVGSLLNAHPEIVIAHELGALPFLARGFSRNQLFWLLLRRDGKFSRSGSQSGGFDYHVPGQWQGRYRRLTVIGDKRGGDASRCLRDHPQLLARLPGLLQVPLRWIHVVRCPFDNIATMARRAGQSLEVASRDYFSMLSATEATLRQCSAEERHQLYHEDFIRQPGEHLQELCRFFQMDCPEDYLRSCLTRVFPAPTNPRLKVEWPETLICSIARQMDEHPSLVAYSRQPLALT